MQLALLRTKLEGLAPEDSHWAEGVISLIVGETKNAAILLTQAAEDSPDDPVVNNDLAAALLALYKETRQSYDLYRALVAADSAADRRPGMLPAHFNLATILEHFSLKTQSQAQWRIYASLDRKTGWAREAIRRNAKHHPVYMTRSRLREQLSSLEEKDDDKAILALSRDFPQEVSRYCEEEVLMNWGAHWLSVSSESTRDLKIARLIGRGLGQESGDLMVRDSVEAIEAALRRKSQGELKSLARGHIAYGKALRLQRQRRDSEASSLFREAEKHLAAGHSPLSAWAKLNEAICQYYKGRYSRSLLQLEAIIKTARVQHRPTLAGRAYWVYGLAKLKTGFLLDSFSAYEKALVYFTRIRDEESQAALHFLLAENLRMQGESVEAWAHRQRALSLGEGFGESVWVHNALFDAAEAASRQGALHVALFFQNEMIESPDGLKEPIFLAEALIRRARTQMKLHQQSKAQSDLEEAIVWASKIADKQRREPVEADIDLARGEMLLISNPQQANFWLGRAVQFQQARGNLVRLPALLLTKAKASLRSGRQEDGTAELEEGIRAYELYQHAPIRERLRGSYENLAEGLFDTMMDLQLRKAMTRRYIEYFERSRVAGLGAYRSSSPVPEEIPRDVCAVGYSMRSRSSWAWTVAEGHLSVVSLNTSIEEVRFLVEDFRRAIDESDSGKLMVLGRTLYAKLLDPVKDCLARGNRVVIIPDKDLYRLPFALLIDGRRFFVENKIISYAPSLSNYLEDVRRDRVLRQQAYAGALILGDPAVNRKRYPESPVLNGGRSEALNMEKIYPNSTVLLYSDASRSNFLRRSPYYTVVHVVSHARLNAEFPLLSFLLLAPNRSEGSGEVYAYNIYETHFGKTRLVVLSACNSMNGAGGSKVNSFGLASSFVSSGVTGVLGSSWDVQDSDSGHVIDQFARYFVAGKDAAASLRLAQVESLKFGGKKANPKVWGGFQILGFSSGLNERK